MELKTVEIEKIIPYENNPRKNDNAVEMVVESIRQCGYIAPIIVDEDMVVLAGHTRLKAIKQLGWLEAQIGVIEGLTEEQKKKYRLLDNKTNEFAGWDFEALAEELSDIDFEGINFGFDDQLISPDFMNDFFEDSQPKEKEPKKIQCPHCGEWFEIS